MNDDYDDLDRALFALPLAAPPRGLREAILRATIDAPARVIALPLGAFETAVLGIICAIGAWLITWILTDHHVASIFTADAYALLGALATPATVAWLAGGGLVVAVFTLAQDGPRGIGGGSSPT